MIVENSVCTRPSSILGVCDEPLCVLASRLQAVEALTALNAPCSASTIARMPSALRAAAIRLFSWIWAAEGRPPRSPTGGRCSCLASARALDSEAF